MESVKIEDIANELGMQSKELIKRIQLLYKDIKSPKSQVSPEVAQEIFDTIVLGINSKPSTNLAICNSKNINLYFSSQKIDITMLEKIANTYKQATQKEFMIRSFNFSELSIVKILAAGLINLDIKKYVELQSTNKELSNLLNNMNKILDDVDFEDIDGTNPLDNFEAYIKKHIPEIVYIEGVDYANFLKYKKVFELIKKLAKDGTFFELGFIKIESELAIDNIKKEFMS